jgi:hydrogenase nickel incorporation protein HypA/HybF
MHEWALAEGVITAADRVAKEQNIIEITEVRVVIGELQQIEHEIILFAFDQLRTERMKKTKFVIETASAKFKCRNCGAEWTFKTAGLKEEESEAIHFVPEMAHVYVKCPECGSPDFEVVEGRGVWLASIKGVKKE